MTTTNTTNEVTTKEMVALEQAAKVAVANGTANMYQEDAIYFLEEQANCEGWQSECFCYEGLYNLLQCEVIRLRTEIAELRTQLEAKEIEEEVTEEAEVEETTEETATSVFFNENVEENVAALESAVNNAFELRDAIKGIFDGDKEENNNFMIYHKICNQFINKTRKLIADYAQKNYSVEKLTAEYVRVFKATVIKLLSQNSISELVESFILSNGFKAHGFEAGETITEDDEFEFIDEFIMYHRTNDRTLRNKIIKVHKDAYTIAYYDKEESEVFETVIPAVLEMYGYAVC